MTLSKLRPRYQQSKHRGCVSSPATTLHGSTVAAHNNSPKSLQSRPSTVIQDDVGSVRSHHYVRTSAEVDATAASLQVEGSGSTAGSKPQTISENIRSEKLEATVQQKKEAAQLKRAQQRVKQTGHNGNGTSVDSVSTKPKNTAASHSRHGHACENGATNGTVRQPDTPRPSSGAVSRTRNTAATDGKISPQGAPFATPAYPKAGMHAPSAVRASDGEHTVAKKKRKAGEVRHGADGLAPLWLRPQLPRSCRS